jgi:prephenate dehydrogenase
MTDAAARPATRVGIVGLGLIGGSIALGLRERWADIEIYGVDRPDVTDEAGRRGVIHHERAAVRDLIDCDLVVLAAPVTSIVTLIDDAARAELTATITDVGSTKRTIATAAEQSRLSNFVGGHPMAGAERGGLQHARADLFQGRSWMIVAGSAPASSVQRVEQLATGLGAEPRRMDAVTHDRVMAYVSHLPQLLATALKATAVAAVGDSGLRAAGRAFHDMTRVAASPADVWESILATNADFIAEAVAACSGRLPAAADLRDPAWVRAAFSGEPVP